MDKETMSCGHLKSSLRPGKGGGYLTCGECVSTYMHIAQSAHYQQESAPKMNTHEREIFYGSVMGSIILIIMIVTAYFFYSGL